MHDELSLSLASSISEDVSDISSSILEVGLDAIMNDGVLKDIPIISTAISIYKIGHSVRERSYLKKLAAFVLALNKGIEDSEERERYQAIISSDEKKRNQELEYIMIIIDRYVQFNKAEILAKFYLAYLDKKLSWLNLTKFAEVLERLLPGDLDELIKGERYDISVDNISDSLVRMEGLGFFVSHSRGPTINEMGAEELVIPDEKIKNYELTAFGKLFLKCLN